MILSRPQCEVEERSKAMRQDFVRRYDLDGFRQSLFDEQSSLCRICRRPIQSSDSILCAVDHGLSINIVANWGWELEFAYDVVNARSNLFAVHVACNSVKREQDLEELDLAVARGEVTFDEQPLLTVDQIRKLKADSAGLYAAAAKKRSQDPKWQAANAEANKRMSQDPKWQAAIAAAVKKRSQDPKWQEAIAAANKKKFQDPKWQVAHAAGMKKMAQDPKWRASRKKISQAMVAAGRKRSQDPKWRSAQAAGAKKSSQNPKWQAANAARMKMVSQDPKWRAANAAALKKTSHERWHTKRGISKPETCELCRKEQETTWNHQQLASWVTP